MGWVEQKRIGQHFLWRECLGLNGFSSGFIMQAAHRLESLAGSGLGWQNTSDACAPTACYRGMGQGSAFLMRGPPSCSSWRI